MGRIGSTLDAFVVWELPVRKETSARTEESPRGYKAIVKEKDIQGAGVKGRDEGERMNNCVADITSSCSTT